MVRYAVLDLEMCNVPRKSRKERNVNEIIEIGAVLLDEDYNCVDEFKTFVSPDEGVVDEYIHDLTGISQKDLEGAPDIRTALEMLSSWIPQETVVITWSDSDERQIRSETERKGICGLCGFLEGCIDCQADFSRRMETRKIYNLKEALIISGIEYDEDIHDALVDARNTAMLFTKMKKEKNLRLTPYYSYEQTEKLSYNPFADLLAGCAV